MLETIRQPLLVVEDRPQQFHGPDDDRQTRPLVGLDRLGHRCAVDVGPHDEHLLLGEVGAHGRPKGADVVLGGNGPSGGQGLVLRHHFLPAVGQLLHPPVAQGRPDGRRGRAVADQGQNLPFGERRAQLFVVVGDAVGGQDDVQFGRRVARHQALPLVEKSQKVPELVLPQFDGVHHRRLGRVGQQLPALRRVHRLSRPDRPRRTGTASPACRACPVGVAGGSCWPPWPRRSTAGGSPGSTTSSRCCRPRR